MSGYGQQLCSTDGAAAVLIKSTLLLLPNVLSENGTEMLVARTTKVGRALCGRILH